MVKVTVSNSIPPIPESIIDELHQKILSRFRIHNIRNAPDLEYLKKHTIVNHETYQVTIYLKEYFKNNMIVQFKRPEPVYQEIEQQDFSKNKTIKSQEKALNNNLLVNVDTDKTNDKNK